MKSSVGGERRERELKKVFSKTIGVNFIPDKNITKDGLHIIFGINADRATQMYIVYSQTNR